MRSIKAFIGFGTYKIVCEQMAHVGILLKLSFQQSAIASAFRQGKPLMFASVSSGGMFWRDFLIDLTFPQNFWCRRLKSQ
ncbi:hypothetical protein CEXT_403101 [Caerostris extrusa]|uniref:Uncharacterized protein n=1 Tax=Caerostris extrusa TaxID=172846 RepID=A0AAV4QS41_CAEEX|nr:hypothetical protein CEXT_403101 [Caerostris extrusa]